LVGERGLGKSRTLHHIEDRVGNVLSLDLSSHQESAFQARLNDALGLARETSLTQAASRLNGHDDLAGILIDGADRLVQPVMGGLAVFDEIIDAARRNSTQSVWIFALDEVIWQFLARARGARPLFDEVIQLGRWSEEKIVALLKSRTEQAGVTPIFDHLLDRLPPNADEVDKQEALAARAANYYRLIWDYAAGNPGVALHMWRRSLGVDADGRCLVRLFEALDTHELEILPDSAVFVLRAVLQLAPATAAAIGKATMIRAAEIADTLRYALARGYVEESEGHYFVTWTWFRPLTTFLRRRHLLAQ
jgi:hypothetical protein